MITTIGATEGIATALQTIMNPGDTLIMPTPVFPIYAPISEINDGNVVTVDTSADGFVLTPERLRRVFDENKDKHFKVLVLVFPSNPTGVTYSREQLQAIADVCVEKDIWVLCDEIYAELTYSGTHTSMAEIIPERTLLLSGLSKSHAMTGWRIGYLFGPQDFVDQAVKSHQYMVTAPVTNAQYAALEAMKNGKHDSDVMKAEYLRRRDFVKKNWKKQVLRWQVLTAHSTCLPKFLQSAALIHGNLSEISPRSSRCLDSWSIFWTWRRRLRSFELCCFDGKPSRSNQTHQRIRQQFVRSQQYCQPAVPVGFFVCAPCDNRI